MRLAASLATGALWSAVFAGRANRERTGEQIYRSTCAACHGADGRGAPRTTVGFANPLPDFTDCNFASRETSTDWESIVRDGGPVRGFSRIMPAFRDLLTPDEIRRVVAYLHTLCGDRRWPRGEFNVPRPQRTEKAFPEDEVVLTSSADTQGPGAVENHLIFEKRFGIRDQMEVDVPFLFLSRPDFASWAGGIGDISITNKYVVVSSLSSGTIVSALGGVILPTGNRLSGFGTGTTTLEGYVLAAQLLPARSFVQFQAGEEVPTQLALAPRIVSGSVALGMTVPFSQITRIWSPIVEATVTRDLVAGAPAQWDIVPQFQISLSALQHVRANLGVDQPITQRGERHRQILAYLLWDTFDGPLLQGWRGWCPGCRD